MKLTLNFMALALFGTAAISGCKKEFDPSDPGALVPKTVEQNASLPSVAVNGTLLHAEAFGNPENPMVVFLHGGPGGDYKNGLNVKQLADDGYYVVFYDQRGSGLSKRHDKNSYTIQVMFDDLSAIIQHYRRNANQKVFLFGHSWGAMLAAGYINAYPTRISGVIFAEPGGFTWEGVEEYGKRSKSRFAGESLLSRNVVIDEAFCKPADKMGLFIIVLQYSGRANTPKVICWFLF